MELPVHSILEHFQRVFCVRRRDYQCSILHHVCISENQEMACTMGELEFRILIIGFYHVQLKSLKCWFKYLTSHSEVLGKST